MKREFDPNEPEQMDVAVRADAELQEDLENLRHLNAWFGSYRLIFSFLRPWLLSGSPTRGSEWYLVDLATGYGDIPREIVRWCRRRNLRVRIDAVDANESILKLAEAASREFPEITFHRGDIRSWQPADKPDLLLCSLALHHFGEAGAREVLENCLASGSERILVSDLRRSRLLQVAVWLVTAILFRAPMTRNDARLSVRRAFDHTELACLARQAGWKDFGHRRLLMRQAIWRNSAFQP